MNEDLLLWLSELCPETIYIWLEAIEPEQLAVAMVVSLFALLLAGYPVAFTIGGVGLVFGFLGLDSLFFNLLPQRIWGIMGNATLLAVPLFVFMGVMLERAGIAERLLASMAALFGKRRSGMPIAVVVSGALLAASTGIVGASVVTMGLISLPVMLKRGYKPTFASGVICASGTLGQIIPPSIVLILLGDIMGVSVGELFIAAVVPGLLLVIAYVLWSVIYCSFVEAPNECLEEEGEEVLWRDLLLPLVAPGVLIVSVLGSIFFSLASPTEAAAVGAFISILLAGFAKRLTWGVLTEVTRQTMQLTSMVFMILVGAQAFGLVFRGLGGDDVIREAVLSLEYGPTMFLLCVMVLLFVLGCFLDFIEIIFIVIPILAPMVAEFGYSKLWFSVLVAVNLQMSFLTPPFGFALFFLKGVAPPEVRSTDIYKGIVPFAIIQCLILGLLLWQPNLVSWLPSLLEPGS